MNYRNLVVFGALSLLVTSVSSNNGLAKSKYGPESQPKAIPLSESNDYFRSKESLSPQFWSLISFYSPQGPGTCSITSAANILNAALTQRPRGSDDKVITTEMLLEKIRKEKWIDQALFDLNQKKYVATLEQFRSVVEKAFRSYGFPNSTVRAIHIKDQSQKTKDELAKDLKKFSSSKNYFIIANFNQQKFTDDADVGHYSPIGAFDSKSNRVLVLDTDREYYEPYWVSLNTFIEGMNTVDGAVNQSRGYLWVSLSP